MRTLGGQLETTCKTREMTCHDLEHEEPEPIAIVGTVRSFTVSSSTEVSLSYQSTRQNLLRDTSLVYLLSLSGFKYMYLSPAAEAEKQ
jgi:hypothetical protein